MPGHVGFLIVFFCVIIVGPAGCLRGDARNDPIAAESAGAFARWRSMRSDLFSGEEWREFDAMLLEIRLRITAERAASGSEAVETVLRQRIHGLGFREVLGTGYRCRLLRLEPEREALRRLINANARRAVLFQAEVATAAEMENARERQEKQMLAIDAQVAAAKHRLEVLGLPATARKPPGP